MTKFNSIAHRIIHGLKFMYSDFAPTDSKNVSVQSQKKLHLLMQQILEKLHENPKLLRLPIEKDEAYHARECNNMRPVLDRAYKSVFKTIYEFYNFLYNAALHGTIEGSQLSISSKFLKTNKIIYKPQYNILLNEFGIYAEKVETEIIIQADAEILQSFKLLAEQVPLNPNPWTPYALINFACCLFADNFDYLLSRVDAANNLNGLLFELQQKCLQNGYEQHIRTSFGATGFDFNIMLQNKIGGFIIVYNIRKCQPFSFGTMNGVSEKAMLADFANLDSDLQQHFIGICKTCNSCLICTKGGKNKIFATSVKHDDKEYNLCPSFPQHSWSTIDHDLTEVLFKYHEAQEKYGVDWRKR